MGRRLCIMSLPVGTQDSLTLTLRAVYVYTIVPFSVNAVRLYPPDWHERGTYKLTCL